MLGPIQFGGRDARVYQVSARNEVLRALEEGHSRICVVLPTGCHAVDTKILMYDGSIKAVQDVVVGDRLMGPDNQPRNVLQLARGTEQMYDIVPKSGDVFRVNGGHVLSLKTVNEGTSKWRQSPCFLTGTEVVNVAVTDYLKWSADKKRLHKAYLANKLEFADQNHKIPAYLMGVYLGDGSSRSGVSITTMDAEIVAELTTFNDLHKLRTIKREMHTPNKASMYFPTGAGHVGGNLWRNELKQLGLFHVTSHHKFIPPVYKIGSAEQRLQLLAGLIDTDGSVSKNTVEYTTVSKQLAQDVQFVARSLGFRCDIKVYARKNNYICYTMHISGAGQELIPTRLARKQLTVRAQRKNVLKTSFEVVPAGIEQYYGFTVDGDNLYVMGNFFVTHNSGKTLTAGIIMVAPELRTTLNIPVGQPLRVLMIAHRHRLLKQAEESYGTAGINIVKDYKNTPFHSTFTGRCDSDVVFNTLSTFSTIPKDLSWDIVILDECHHESCLTFQHKLEQISAKPIIGLTATPSRADGVLCKFSKFVETISREDAVAAGYLANSHLYSFIDSPAREHVDMVMDIIDLKLKSLGQTMVFVRTKQEAIDVCTRLDKMGLKAVALVNIKEKTLNEELTKFEKGTVQFVVSCNKIGEGTDVKGCESVIIGRTTQSLPLLSQVVGRSSRNDCESHIYEIINPLSNSNISTSDLLEPQLHEIWYKVRHQWRHHVVA